MTANIRRTSPHRTPATDGAYRLVRMVHPLKTRLQGRGEPWPERGWPNIDRRISCWCGISATIFKRRKLESVRQRPAADYGFGQSALLRPHHLRCQRVLIGARLVIEALAEAPG